jgi:hypothetical protein
MLLVAQAAYSAVVVTPARIVEVEVTVSVSPAAVAVSVRVEVVL